MVVVVTMMMMVAILMVVVVLVEDSFLSRHLKRIYFNNLKTEHGNIRITLYDL